MYLGKSESELKELQALNTAREISQQPRMWRETYQLIDSRRKELRDFINQITSQPESLVILTGAGSSEFVGHASSVILNQQLDQKVHTYGTPDIVASPHHYLSSSRPTLMVSFARSGNSPESIGAIAAADAICDNIQHLFITCNRDGELAKSAASRDDALAIVLPPETNDQGFAMTSSFSSMYLSVLLAFATDQRYEELVDQLHSVCHAAESQIENFAVIEKLVQESKFNRIVYLGSGSFKGIARESALKMLELTRGKVASLHESPLGFRHGPKSFLDENTLTIFFISPESDTYRYELDLIKEMSQQSSGYYLLAFSESEDNDLRNLVDQMYLIDTINVGSDLLALNYLVGAQFISYYKSLELDLTPDNPFPSGEVNRVVKGVTIYPISEG